MSGIIGIVNLDGAPVERELLQRLTEFMAEQGPDAQDIWIDGSIGFGHALLRTTFESQYEHQPFSLDGQVWIVADARVDGREDLIEKLGVRSQVKLNTVTDVELILRAYHAWGEDCVRHLIGDFTFGIWDGQKRRLFCARDQFGVKPFYYACVRDCLVFSTTLNCLRLHPAVSDELNDLAIADFLLFGSNREIDTTTFADIQRLPAAHYLTWWQGKQPVIKRYWMLTAGGLIQYRRASDYVDQFKELWFKAISDRLRIDSVGVYMSGGLDSTSIAATAHKLLSQQPTPYQFQAYTGVYDWLIPDEERYYSGLVAAHLDIPIHYSVADDDALYEGWENPKSSSSEPSHNPLSNAIPALVRNRVVLGGLGGDVLISASSCYFEILSLLSSLQFKSLFTKLGSYLSGGRLPPLGLRARLKQWLGIRPWWQSSYPPWLNPDFAIRLDLETRWQQVNSRSELLTSSDLVRMLEYGHPGVVGFPFEFRYPFFDLRLVEYLLNIPPLTDFKHKGLLRLAMQGFLPERVRCRPKAPLPADPFYERLNRDPIPWEILDAMPEISTYIDKQSLLQALTSDRDNFFKYYWVNLRPIGLAHWLKFFRMFANNSPVHFSVTHHQIP